MNNIYLFTLHEKFEVPRVTETSRPNAIKAVTTTKVFLRSEFEKHGKKAKPLSEGIAECAVGDQFSRKLGRRISAGRSLKKLGLKMIKNRIEQIQGSVYKVYDLDRINKSQDRQNNLYTETLKLHESGITLDNFNDVVKLLEKLSAEKTTSKIRIDTWIGTKVVQSLIMTIPMT